MGMYTGCSDSEANGVEGEVTALPDPPERPCGSPLLLSVRGEGPSLGVFEVMNDTYNLWISFNHTAKFQLDRISAFIGSEIQIPRKEGGILDAEKFNVQSTEPSVNGKWVYSIPLEGLPECMTMAVRVELTDLEPDGDDQVHVKGWGHSGRQGSGFTFRYCKQSCFWTSKCAGVDPGQFVTVGANEWTSSNGEFSRQLASQFEQLFPGGMEIGCNTEIRIKTVDELEEMFANQGTPKILERNYDGDAGSLNNNFANELCALAITIGFDERNPDFCVSGERLKNLEITQGAFKDWTVAEVFNEANTVLGGCTSNYSAFQMAEVLSEINGNFRNGTANGFLECPKAGI